MRVVIDTNVFISSFWGGKPGEIIKLWQMGQLTLCLSPEIIDEYLELFQRKNIHQTTECVHLMGLFARQINMVFVADPPKLYVIDDDPDDNKFIECAVALDAKIIISGDKHLLKLKRYVDIDIFSPHNFLEINNAKA